MIQIQVMRGLREFATVYHPLMFFHSVEAVRDSFVRKEHAWGPEFPSDGNRVDKHRWIWWNYSFLLVLTCFLPLCEVTSHIWAIMPWSAPVCLCIVRMPASASGDLSGSGPRACLAVLVWYPTVCPIFPCLYQTITCDTNFFLPE